MKKHTWEQILVCVCVRIVRTDKQQKLTTEMNRKVVKEEGINLLNKNIFAQSLFLHSLALPISKLFAAFTLSSKYS